MSSSLYRAWWREMGAISRGMMFIEGNIATPAALQSGESKPEIQPPAQSASAPAPSALQDKARWLLEDLLLLGGRPVTLPHNDDINEPLPLLHRRHRRNAAGGQRKAAAAADICATC